jgi:hypothetical protein
LFSIFLFGELNYSWWVFPLLLLAPDLGAMGYAAGTRVGAWTYNLLHHRGLAIVVYLAGTVSSIMPLALAGVIMLGHSSFDRVLGYGLKYGDSFRHTHLGWIGRGQES